MTLQFLKKKLEEVPGLSISERGTGKAQFLYVRSQVRALEVSIEGSGCFIEYWNEADEESDKSSVNCELIVSASEALAKITNWLGR